MQLEIRPITAQDDSAIKQIIEQVGKEYGAIGDGFGPSDAEVEHMSRHYAPQYKSQYWVALLDGKVVGGSGIAQFANDPKTCELRKLFLLPETRGYGIGKKLTQTCLDFATQQGYHQCYLDTLSSMEGAIKLYLSEGFSRLDKPLDGTLHNGCDVWMLKSLIEN